MGPPVRALVGRHGPIGDGVGAVTGEFARQRTRGLLQDPGGSTQTISRSKQATEFFTLYEGQALVGCHVQLLRSWTHQDTGVALEP
jgi:hypothetical protein